MDAAPVSMPMAANLQPDPETNDSNREERMKTARAAGFSGFLLAVSAATPAKAELHLQFGKLLNPFSGAQEQTLVFTLQQASGWKYGDSFFFIDHLDDSGDDGFNDREFYAEWYPTLSLGKLSGRELGLGPIVDLSLVAGVNAGGDGNVLKYLPGLRASWDLPGFLFLNTDLTAYIDDNAGLASGGPPKTGNSLMLDVSWALSLEVGGQSLAIAGHAEYVGGSTDELDGDVRGWVLAQPQFTWDLGRALLGAPHRLLAGIEYQYWHNKLGTNQQESTAQLLLVWRP